MNITDTLPAVAPPEPEPEPATSSGKRGDGGFVVELDPLWAERLRKLAGSNADPTRYLEDLIKREWVASAGRPAALRGGP